MSVSSIIYKLLIGPLELFFEVVFTIAYRAIDHPGLAIIALSLAINILVLPLYRRADIIQAEEAATEKKMEYWVNHIKKTFKGDERFMMLQTYYRQNDYKPSYALRGSLSLLLEIPFFIAAYHFLSNLEMLNLQSFGPIRDLGAPDALISIGAISINLLPLLMTATNCISAAIYTKGMPRKTKIQLYAFAAIFLVFLYNSPAGLVFYWTLNNVFSFFKNVVYRIKEPVANYLRMKRANKISKTKKQKDYNTILDRPTTFRLGTVFLAAVTGLLIPSTIIAASPAEFIDITDYVNPAWYVVSATVLAIGMFVIWFNVFYSLLGNAGKRLFNYAIWGLSVAGLVDYFFFGTNLGNLSSSLVYDVLPAYSKRSMLINLLVILVIMAVAYVIWKKKTGIVHTIFLAGIVVFVGMSILNIRTILVIADQTRESAFDTVTADAELNFSTNGQNVVVIMLDRAISGYFPYLIEEKPELKELFSGFTYYPNTTSFGVFTNFGTPGIYGGYEYTPEEMNKRDTELLVDKHDEALLVMPRLFSENDFKVTVCDPVYAGYTWVPTMSVFEEYPEINTCLIENVLGQEEKAAFLQTVDLYRNFFCFSIFKMAPVVAQPILYYHGCYNNPTEYSGSSVQNRQGLSVASGASEGFLNTYYSLCSWKGITTFTEEKTNTFTMLTCTVTHEPMMLDEANGYVPTLLVDNTAFDAEHAKRYDADGNAISFSLDGQIIHYQANMAALLKIGEWLTYLKENGAYDNTRIIIVSDHGAALGQFEELLLDDSAAGDDVMADAMFCEALLLVKDFDATGGISVEETLMTNADTPTLATEGLIEDPVNPFTGNAINNEAKTSAEELHVFYSHDYDILTNNGTTFHPGVWYSVKDDVRDSANWKVIPEP